MSTWWSRSDLNIDTENRHWTLGLTCNSKIDHKSFPFTTTSPQIKFSEVRQEYCCSMNRPANVQWRAEMWKLLQNEKVTNYISVKSKESDSLTAGVLMLSDQLSNKLQQLRDAPLSTRNAKLHKVAFPIFSHFLPYLSKSAAMFQVKKATMHSSVPTKGLFAKSEMEWPYIIHTDCTCISRSLCCTAAYKIVRRR